MADTITNASPVLSLCATIGDKMSDLPFVEGQMIFVQDKHNIAFDFNGKRRFYRQIEEVTTESARLSILAPVTGRYYFVIETAVLWTYQGDWVQITKRPEEIVFIGTAIPELGKEQTLYVNTSEKSISVWQEGEYVVVADKTHDITTDDIAALFE